MKIRKQTWIETDKYIQVTLHQPYWGAWKKYNWPEGVEGLGISKEAINYAHAQGKKIRVQVIKYGKYEISPLKVKQVLDMYNSRFVARDGKVLIIVPRTACTKVEKTPQQIKDSDKKEQIRAFVR